MEKTIQKLKLAALALTCLLLPSAQAHSADPFKVCADPQNPPYSTKELTGYENKIAALFAQQLGQDLVFSWHPDRIGFIRNTLKAELEGGGYVCDVIIGLPTGSELAATTKPYLRSAYVLLIAQGRGWDDIEQPSQLASLPLQRQEQLKIAMFDRGPGTAWLQQTGLLQQGVPYQSMTGDKEHNVAMQIEQDLRQGVIDMVILWGPMAAYVQNQSPPSAYRALVMQSTPQIKFDFDISMAVRQNDPARKEALNQLIDRNRDNIQAIIASYGIISLPLTEAAPEQDKP